MTMKQSFILLVVFIIYLSIGGLIFMFLENGSIENIDTVPVAECDIRQEVEEKLEEWNISNYKNLSISAEYLLQTLDDIFNVCSRNTNFTDSITYREWKFYDAFFFSLTVVTTIGYGHLSPITNGGQIFCIFYSLIGIPMTGILIAGFGDIFSAVLLRAHERSKSERFNSTFALVVNTIFYLIPGTIIFLFLPAIVFAYLENWTYLKSFYYAFITLTTIGFGDLVAGHDNEFDNRWIYQIGISVWIIFGLGYWAMMLNFLSKAMKSKQVKRFNKTVTRGFRQTQRMFSKEMEEFMRNMNQYSTKIMPKPHTRLKRTMSLPLFWKKPIGDFGRCSSDSALIVHAPKHEDDMYFSQQEAHTNTMGFIFQLAKAFAYGDLGDTLSNRSMLSLNSVSRHPSLLELITESIVQASRKNSMRGGNIFDINHPQNRFHPNRRSCDFRTQGLLDLPRNSPTRRRSDFGCYLDTSQSGAAVSPSDTICILQEVNELESHETSSSRDNLMFEKETPPLKQNGIPKSSRKSSRVTSQEIDELITELKQLEQLWTPPKESVTNKLPICEPEQKIQSEPTVEFSGTVSPRKVNNSTNKDLDKKPLLLATEPDTVSEQTQL